MEPTKPIFKGPLGSLPIELYLQIFEDFIPKSHNRREIVPVINLTSVCRDWRRVILNTSAFWTYVTINPSFNEQHHSRERYPARLELQLQRTGAALLHISWYMSVEVHPDVMNIVFKYAPLERWRSLSLCHCSKVNDIDWRFGASFVSAAPCFPPLIGKLDNLESLLLWGDTTLPPQLVELVERSALRLRRLEASRDVYSRLKRNFPQTLRRIEMYAAGVPHKTIVARSISTRPSTPPREDVITSHTVTPSNPSQKQHRRPFICF